MHIEVLHFWTLYAPGDHSAGQLRFSASCGLEQLGCAVVSGSDAVLDALGMDGYARQWKRAGFPTAELNGLKVLLEARY